MGKKVKEQLKSKHSEVKGLILLAVSFVLFISLISFIQGESHKNWLGMVGYLISYLLHFVMGLSSYLLVFYLGYCGYRFLKNEEEQFGIKTLYFGLFLICCCLIFNVFAEHFPVTNPIIQQRVFSETLRMQHPFPYIYSRFNLGGVPFYYLYRDLPTLNLQRLLSDVGIIITFSLTGFVACVLWTEASLMDIARNMRNFFISFSKQVGKEVRDVFKKNEKLKAEERPIQPEIPKLLEPIPLQIKTLNSSPPPPTKEPPLPEIKEHDIHAYTDKKKMSPTFPIRESGSAKPKNYDGDYKNYRLPPLSLLTNAKMVDQPTLKRDLAQRAQVLEETLQSFGVEAKVGQINCGPTITSFEVHPPIGVKVQKIKVLENDIALNMQAKSIRIIAPIPGKAAVGVEVPSLHPQEVGFKEMLHSYQNQKHKLNIPVLLGKTVSGDDVMCDLTKMPHCIIAGATGSGKSVCINTIVLSILMNARPDEVKLMLVDPKKVELSAYSNLPHMISPVITEPHGAYAALHWLVKEMQVRYEILKQLGLRNIHAFNSRKPNLEVEESIDMPIPKKMSFMVAIIDEFADLMMQSSSDLETPIARIAQMARAVGIHLILATQRPSREVITGLIKANFPTRISFKVASRINSQIILDENGAESLLGNGDMLFLPPGSSQLMRAQGAFIRDEDLNRVLEYIEKQASPNYLIKSFDEMAKEDILPEESSEAPQDDLYSKALTIVLQTRTASTTFLQRKLKIGYARAAGLMDELEDRGVISPQDGAKPRRILVDSTDM